MRYLIGALFLAFQTFANPLLSTEKPIIYYVTQNPISTHYGDPIASYLATKFKSHQVLAYYMQMDVGGSRSNAKYLLDIVVRDVNNVKPDYVFVYNSGIATDLKRELGNKYKVADFSIVSSNTDIVIENPIAKLLHVLSEFDYEYGRVHILTDQTNQSGRNARLYKALFEGQGIKESRIDILKFENVKQLELKLRSLNAEPHGIIINAMYVLKDQELSKFSYAVDLKNIVVRINRKHIDINGYLSPEENEALIFSIDTKTAGDYFAHSVLGTKTKLSGTVKFRVTLNAKRMNELGFKDNYLRGLHTVDALTNE